jgi:transposase
MNGEKEALQRVQGALYHLRQGLAPFVEARMKAKHGPQWQVYASRAAGGDLRAALDEYGLLKTMIDQRRDVFEEAFSRAEKYRVRNFVSTALEARNATSHLSIPLQDDEALRYLDAIHQVLRAVKAPEVDVAETRRLYDEQRRSGLATTPAPDHAIARGRAGAGLLAHIVVSKYDDHLPLYRQAEIFARDGVNLETSTLCGWVGATAAALQPLADALATDVLASGTLHVDDTPVPVLAPGTGKTKTGRLWTPASAGAGSTFAMSGRSLVRGSRRPCSFTRPTAKACPRESGGRASAGASEGIPRRHPRRRLRRVQ